MLCLNIKDYGANNYFSILLIFPFFPQGAERLGYKQTEGDKQTGIITKKLSPGPKRLTKKQQELQGKLHEGSFFANGEKFISSSSSVLDAHVVYCISCNKSECNYFYVGQTGRQLNIRLIEHKCYVKEIIYGTTLPKHFSIKSGKKCNFVDNIVVYILAKNVFDEKLRVKIETYWIKMIGTANHKT